MLDEFIECGYRQTENTVNTRWSSNIFYYKTLGKKGHLCTRCNSGGVDDPEHFLLKCISQTNSMMCYINLYLMISIISTD